MRCSTNQFAKECAHDRCRLSRIFSGQANTTQGSRHVVQQSTRILIECKLEDVQGRKQRYVPSDLRDPNINGGINLVPVNLENQPDAFCILVEPRPILGLDLAKKNLRCIFMREYSTMTRISTHIDILDLSQSRKYFQKRYDTRHLLPENIQCRLCECLTSASCTCKKQLNLSIWFEPSFFRVQRQKILTVVSNIEFVEDEA